VNRDQKKRKEGGTRKGAREQALAPKELSPPPPHRRRPAPSNTTAAQHSSLQQHTRRPHARERRGAQMPDPHGVHEGGAGAIAGRLTEKTYRQTETATKRETQRRGVGKRGAVRGGRTSKTKEQSSGDGGARSGSVSLVLTDESQSSAPSV